MNNFTDIFKKNFLAEFGTISLSNAMMTLGIAFLLALIIFAVYRTAFSGVVYSKNFNISLVVVCMITCVIVIAISTNIVLSLGMVGALSIVRFRTAIKEPIDVAYMYWAITTGIVCGAKLYTFALGATLSIGLVFIIMNRVQERSSRQILIVNYTKNALLEVEKVLSQTTYVIKSRSISNSTAELVAEIKVNKKNVAFLNNLQQIENVTNVSLVSYKGD